jgi:hypothetical protein
MCSLNQQFYYVNPSTQLALVSICFGDCLSVVSIQWNIYQGSIDSMNKTVQWNLFPSITSSLFFGIDIYLIERRISKKIF